MKRPRFDNLWHWDGVAHREEYVAIGLGLTAVKFAIDAAVAQVLFDRVWTPAHYLIPSHYAGLFQLRVEDRVFFGTLLLYSLPFAWIGAMLTVQRLRAAALPRWLVLLFFAPPLNLVLLLACAVTPTRGDPAELSDNAGSAKAADWFSRLIPVHRLGSALLAIALTGGLGLGVTALSASVLGVYGWGVFTLAPFAMGMFAALIYGGRAPRGIGESIGVAMIGIVGGLMFVLLIEGLVCLVMASPIWSALCVAGAVVGVGLAAAVRGELVQRGVLGSVAGSIAIAAVAGVVIEAVAPGPATTRSVTTSVSVGAPADAVWEQVVAFPALPEPRDWMFTAGVAYPTRARIEGRGVGAVRYCEFSTGAFVEPITAWDAPRRLAFSVSHNPPPLREVTFGNAIHPPHLEGYLESQRGEFRLIQRGDGTTELVGTTWYRNRMWPAAYWGLWSDAIIGRIHERVLGHVRGLAESGGAITDPEVAWTQRGADAGLIKAGATR